MKSVIESLCAVSESLAATGISKDQKTNFGEQYTYRGIDDVYNKIGPLLAEHKLVFAPVKVSSQTRQAQTSQGKPTNHTRVTIDYAIISPGGDQPLMVQGEGEAFDMGDKGLEKAKSAAFKGLVFQLFCIPVEGKDIEQDNIQAQQPAEQAMMLVDQAQVNSLKGIYDVLSEANRERFDSWFKTGGVATFDQLAASNFDDVKGVLDKIYGQQYAEEQAATAQSMGGTQ